jgi:hypothetical protein
MQELILHDGQKELDGMILDENKKEQCEDDPRAATAPTPDKDVNEFSSIMSSSSSSSYDSDDEKDIPWPMTSYLSSSSASSTANHEYCHHSMGSFSVSVLSTTSSPIDFIDEQGNLPLTQVSSILPAVAEEQEEDDNSEADGALLLQFVPTKDTCRTSTSSTENDTLSTAGTGTTTVCTTTSSSYRLPESPLSSNMERIKLESIEQHQSRVTSIDSCSCTNEDQMRAAMLVMKDVIFRQRSAMKKVSKEHASLQKKYEFCKLQNISLSKANQEMNKGMKRTLRKSEALEQQVINLRRELLFAKEEILRLKNQEI